MSDTATVTQDIVKTITPKLFRIILHDDSYTSMEFVTAVLMEVFNYNEDDAHHLMLEVHHYGQGIVGTFTQEIAEVKVEQVRVAAEAYDFPLLATMEEN